MSIHCFTFLCDFILTGHYLFVYPSIQLSLSIWLSTMDVLWEQVIHLSTYRFWEQMGMNYVCIHLSILEQSGKHFKKVEASFTLSKLRAKQRWHVHLTAQCGGWHATTLKQYKLPILKRIEVASHIFRESVNDIPILTKMMQVASPFFFRRLSRHSHVFQKVEVPSPSHLRKCKWQPHSTCES